MLAVSQVEAGLLGKDAYGCARCQTLKWEHRPDGEAHSFHGHDYQERDKADGAGLCGGCYAPMLAGRGQEVRHATT